MQFEWDEKKNRLNTIKHAVSFEVAARVFADPYRLEMFDEGHSQVEERWITIGMVPPAILVVVYTERANGDVVRLISARQANEKEQRTYYQI
ncbi:MAG: hypothetical protein DELT_01774 [Desulfovibrio sp.]